MKAYIIESGHFSKAGNFVAYSTKGERIHIYKKDILREFPQAGIVYRCLGQYENELIKFPFYCLANEKTFDYIDFDGTKTGDKFTRLTAEVISINKFKLKTISCELNYDGVLKWTKQDDATDVVNDLEMEITTLNHIIDGLKREKDKLEKRCQEHENTIMDLQADDMKSKHVISKIEKLTQDYFNKLIV